MNSYNKKTIKYGREPLDSRLQSSQGQKGAALLVSLIMILLVLLLAVVAMRSVTLESRTTANQLVNQRMYETADGTLREGERIILQHGVSLMPCDAASGVVSAGIPCYVADAQVDTNELKTDFTSKSDLASGFEKPYGHWYPRYLATECPKGQTAASALSKATSGCTEYHEVNAQATEVDAAKKCGPDGLCLRSAVNMFVK